VDAFLGLDGGDNLEKMVVHVGGSGPIRAFGPLPGSLWEPWKIVDVV
jgi:hypothetical protein